MLVMSLHHRCLWYCSYHHYNDFIMSAMAFPITSLMFVYSFVYLGADPRKHQSSASLAFVRGIHRWPVNSPHKGPVTRKMLPFWWRYHTSDRIYAVWLGTIKRGVLVSEPNHVLSEDPSNYWRCDVWICSCMIADSFIVSANFITIRWFW